MESEKNNDGSLKMKARILQHGSKEKEKDNLKAESLQCPPTGIRILMSIATMMKYPLPKIDFTSTFLQTRAAKLEIYVAPFIECRRNSFYWFPLTSAYGLVNANAKCKSNVIFLFSNIGCINHALCPSYFMLLITKISKLWRSKLSTMF